MVNPISDFEYLGDVLDGPTLAEAEVEREIAIEREDGDIWADDPNAERAYRQTLIPDVSNTNLNEVPQEWIDPATAPAASRAQAAADAGILIEDTDGDGVTDAGEFIADTDPLDPTDVRGMGWTEDFDPSLGGDPDSNVPAILED
jgi:hypothetical protein